MSEKAVAIEVPASLESDEIEDNSGRLVVSVDYITNRTYLRFDRKDYADNEIVLSPESSVVVRDFLTREWTGQ